MFSPTACDRRGFLAAAGFAAGTVGLGWANSMTAEAASLEKTYKKAVKLGMVQLRGPVVGKFHMLKELGFDGVEVNTRFDGEAGRDELVRARDESGLPIHGVVPPGWLTALSHPDPAERARGVEDLKTAMRDSKRFGGTSVLVVPARVGADMSYADAYSRTQESVRKALPLAEELDIQLLFENVWNNFLLSPLETARFIDEFESPMVGVYFDVGNIVRYGWPEQWIRILGDRIKKLDIKEFSRKLSDSEGLRKGFAVELLEGDCNWPAVMSALREIGYSGWGTAEIPGGGRDRMTEIAARMDRIFAS